MGFGKRYKSGSSEPAPWGDRVVGSGVRGGSVVPDVGTGDCDDLSELFMASSDGEAGLPAVGLGSSCSPALRCGGKSSCAGLSLGGYLTWE